MPQGVSETHFLQEDIEDQLVPIKYSDRHNDRAISCDAFVIGVSEVLDKDELSCNCVGGTCYLLVTPLLNKHGRETVYYQITDVDDTGLRPH